MFFGWIGLARMGKISVYEPSTRAILIMPFLADLKSRLGPGPIGGIGPIQKPDKKPDMGVGVDTSESFGVWLRGQRQHRLGLTQAQLAERVFCSETTIRKIERGSRRPGRDLARHLLIETGVPLEELAAHTAWARGLPNGDEAPHEQESAPAREIELNSPGNGAQFVLVPLDAIASFGSKPPAVVQLQEPFMGRSQWVPVPLAAVAIFGMTPPCWGDECSGLDPEISRCARESVTVDGRDIVDPVTGAVVGTVELRYSQACQTNWVRITRLCREGRRLQAYLRDEIGNMLPSTNVGVDASAVYGYGSMWFAPTGKIAVQACGLIDGYAEVCTSLH